MNLVIGRVVNTSFAVQWNPDTTRCHGDWETGKMYLLCKRGFVRDGPLEIAGGGGVTFTKKIPARETCLKKIFLEAVMPKKKFVQRK